MLDMVLTPVIPISWRWRQVISPWGLLLASLAKVVNSRFSGRLSKNWDEEWQEKTSVNLWHHQVACPHTYEHVYLNVHKSVNMCTWMSTHLWTCVLECPHAYEHTYLNVHTPGNIRTCIPTYLGTYILVCTYIDGHASLDAHTSYMHIHEMKRKKNPSESQWAHQKQGRPSSRSQVEAEQLLVVIAPPVSLQKTLWSYCDIS